MGTINKQDNKIVQGTKKTSMNSNIKSKAQKETERLCKYLKAKNS